MDYLWLPLVAVAVIIFVLVVAVSARFTFPGVNVVDTVACFAEIPFVSNENTDSGRVAFLVLGTENKSFILVIVCPVCGRLCLYTLTFEATGVTLRKLLLLV